ncbi:MAG: hypothetical protein FK734_07790 [Asgard group archaeon]|nr:hypothetical protein [Asgard group archaeon]
MIEEEPQLEINADKEMFTVKKRAIVPEIVKGISVLVISWDLYSIVGLINYNILKYLLPAELNFVNYANLSGWQLAINITVSIILVGSSFIGIILIAGGTIIDEGKEHKKLQQTFHQVYCFLVFAVALKLILAVILKIIEEYFYPNSLLYWDLESGGIPASVPIYAIIVTTLAIIPLIDVVFNVIALNKIRLFFKKGKKEDAEKKNSMFMVFIVLAIMLIWLAFAIWMLVEMIDINDPMQEVIIPTKIYKSFYIIIGLIMMFAYIEVVGAFNTNYSQYIKWKKESTSIVEE